MRSFVRSMIFTVLLVFVGIPALGAASVTVSGNESLDNPLAGWNSILLGLGDDQLRSATENILNFADRFSRNDPANVEEVGGGLSGPPTRRGRGAEGFIPDKHSLPPSDPEDELARFVSQMLAAECVHACQTPFHSAMTYPPFTSLSPLPSRG